MSINVSLKSELTIGQVISEIRGECLPRGLLDIVWGYIPVEAAYIDSSRSLFRSYVDFSDPEIVQSYLAWDLKRGLDRQQALDIAKRTYEIAPYAIREDQRYGMAYPMNPEVLAYAMQNIKEREGNCTVCEIACASGEMGLFFALAGAKQVIFNDIDRNSIQSLKRQLSANSEKVKKICTVVEGNCFDLLKKCPTLKNKVDLILCRNLIHFFTNKEQVQFFQLITKMLKSGGQAILTVNSIYIYKELAIEKQVTGCSESSFQVTKCFIHNLMDETHGQVPCDILYQTLEPCSDDLISSSQFQQYFIYEKNGIQWRENQQELNKLDPSLKQQIKKLWSLRKEELEQILVGKIRVVMAHIRMYNPTSLMQLAQTHSFDPISVFLTDITGHLVLDFTEALEKGSQLGIVSVKR